MAVYDNGVYSGTNGDESIFPISADMVSEKDWSDGQRDYVQDQQAKAESIFQDMVEFQDYRSMFMGRSGYPLCYV